MTDQLWQMLVQFTGAVNALLLGVALLGSPRLHRTWARQKLGGALLAYAYLLFSFTAVDNLWIPSVWWIWIIDHAVALLASALFLDYMACALRRDPVSRWAYAVPIIVVALCALIGPAFVAEQAINVVVLVQIGYSSLTTALYLSARGRLTKRPRHLVVLLTGLWVVHAFQLSLMLAPDVGWLFDAVPVAGAVLMLALTVLVLTDPRSLRSLTGAVPAPSEPSLCTGTLERYMREERPHLDPGLSLEDLATAIGTPARELSRMLADSYGSNFYQFVNKHRIAEARRLLTDPDEQRTSIEAIALMAGFRSRSSFYNAFRRETGQTPAQFRTAPEQPG